MLQFLTAFLQYLDEFQSRLAPLPTIIQTDFVPNNLG
jgi:hypothetical protein